MEACSVKPVKSPSQPDPFKPLGSTTVGDRTTLSFAAEIGDRVILKTVTIQKDSQSEALLPLEEVRIVPTSIEGFYKIVGA